MLGKSRTAKRTNLPRGLQPSAVFTTRFIRRAVRPLGTFKIVNLRVTGYRHIPDEGATIIASNHIGNFDPVYLWPVLKRVAIAIAKKELWKIFFVGWVMRLLGHIAIDRGNRDSAKETVDNSIKVLDHGGVLIIYPEGTTSRDEKVLLPCKAGFAQIAFATGAPVIPSVVLGTNRVARKRFPWINLRQLVVIAFCEAMDPKQYTGETARQDFIRDWRHAVETKRDELIAQYYAPSS